jgi:undecaprenyl-diphosphatase
MDPILTAILLGIVEGLTEFVPVSSTGHLILATELFGYDAHQWALFNVVIQLGAILAVVVLYWGTFWRVLVGLFRLDPESIRFVRNVLAAFLPSAVLGVILKDQIDVLLGSPSVVAWALIAGGIAILGIEKVARPGPYLPVADIPLGKCFGVGFAQCLSMIPGVSRSGATIMGASTLELADKHDELIAGAGGVGWTEIAIGFAVSFIVALAVIKVFVAYVSRHGFAPFAWYRIAAGALAVWLLWP